MKRLWPIVPKPKWQLTPLTFFSRSISFHLIWTQLIWALHCSSHLKPPNLIQSHPISCPVFSVFFTSYLLVSSLLASAYSADHNCSHLFSWHLNLSFRHLFSVSSPEHFSFQLPWASPLHVARLNSGFFSSSQLFSALHSSCHLISCLLTSSLLFSQDSKLNSS